MTPEQEQSERERADEGAPAVDEASATVETEDGAAEQVEQDSQHQRRPQTPPPDLAAANRERDEYLELAQRTRADFDNYRKRVANAAAEAAQRGKADLARELVPVLDNLERALAAAENDGRDDPLAKGVGLVRDELRSLLERVGVEAYDPVGERFDPSWHEAISTPARASAA